MQAFPLYIEATISPIRVSRRIKPLNSRLENFEENVTHARSFCVTSIAEKYLPNIHLSDTYEFTSAVSSKSKRGHSTGLRRRKQTAKPASLNNILFTTLDVGKKSLEASPIILDSKQPQPRFRNVKLEVRHRVSFSPISPTRLKTTKHRILQPFLPQYPEASMVIRPASFTQVVSKEAARVQTASPSYRKTVEVKVPST